jgi:mevalonate kinase
LFGEHAVVYGRPAIAAPVQQVRARAEIWSANSCIVDAVDLNRQLAVAQAPAEDPLALIVRLTCERLQRPLPPWRIRVTSAIPLAAGLGSGAAISTAVVRAMLAGFNEQLENADVSALVYEVEKIHHGAPSGIDNTVVAYEQPVWFVRGQQPQPFAMAHPLHWLIADTGVVSPTRIAVGDVRRAWQQNPTRLEALFDAAGDIARQARTAIETGDATVLGSLMDENQRLLMEMGVSSPELERLIQAARDAGALGAKLSGAGRGGNMIALVQKDDVGRIRQALLAAGAVRVIATVAS